MPPLVSCIIPTTESRSEKWFPKAIECFVNQTHGALELVVAADTQHNSATLSNVMGLPVTVICGQWAKLGAKRNAAVAAARGEYIAHLDDDDWSAPDRISTQLNTLITTGKAVTGFSGLKFVDEGGRWYQYLGSPGYAPGSTHFYRRDWWEKHPFDASMHIGEDREFCSEAVRNKMFIGTPDVNLMFATIHSGNTSVRPIHSVDTFRPLPGFRWPK